MRTPTLAACPEGITRATVLDICRAQKIAHEVCDLSLAELYRADEAFCTGTMGELAGVTRWTAAPSATAGSAPMTERLSALFAERTASGGTRVVSWIIGPRRMRAGIVLTVALSAAGCATPVARACGTAETLRQRARPSPRAVNVRRCGSGHPRSTAPRA